MEQPPVGRVPSPGVPNVTKQLYNSYEAKWLIIQVPSQTNMIMQKGEFFFLNYGHFTISW